jgi:hypothetical protein
MRHLNGLQVALPWFCCGRNLVPQRGVILLVGSDSLSHLTSAAGAAVAPGGQCVILPRSVSFRGCRSGALYLCGLSLATRSSCFARSSELRSVQAIITRGWNAYMVALVLQENGQPGIWSARKSPATLKRRPSRECSRPAHDVPWDKVEVVSG